MKITYEAPPVEAVLPLEQTCPECKSTMLVETLDDLTIALEVYSENSYGDSTRRRVGIDCPVCRKRGKIVVFFLVTGDEGELLEELLRRERSR